MYRCFSNNRLQYLWQADALHAGRMWDSRFSDRASRSSVVCVVSPVTVQAAAEWVTIACLVFNTAVLLLTCWFLDTVQHASLFCFSAVTQATSDMNTRNMQQSPRSMRSQDKGPSFGRSPLIMPRLIAPKPPHPNSPYGEYRTQRLPVVLSSAASHEAACS